MDKMHFTSEIAGEPDKVELTHNGFVSSRINFALELYFLSGETVETPLALSATLREYAGSSRSSYLGRQTPLCPLFQPGVAFP